MALIEVIEGMEKLLLRGGLAGDELDIVHEKQIRAAVFAAELGISALLKGCDQLIRELVSLDVDDVVIRVLFVDDRGDGIEQVRLAETRRAVDKKRIGRFRRNVRHGQRRRMCKAVGRADHEAVECELRIEFDEFRLFCAALAIGLHLLLAEDDKLDVLLEQVLHRVLNVSGAAAEDDVLAIVGGGIQHKPGVGQLDDLDLVEPCGHDRRGQAVFHVAKDLGPNIGGGVHAVGSLPFLAYAPCVCANFNTIRIAHCSGYFKFQAAAIQLNINATPEFKSLHAFVRHFSGRRPAWAEKSPQPGLRRRG